MPASPWETRRQGHRRGPVGHAESWDATERDGTFASRSCRVTYKSGGKTLAVLTLARDRESLEAEAAMEENGSFTGTRIERS